MDMSKGVGSFNYIFFLYSQTSSRIRWNWEKTSAILRVKYLENKWMGLPNRFYISMVFGIPKFNCILTSISLTLIYIEVFFLNPTEFQVLRFDCTCKIRFERSIQCFLLIKQLTFYFNYFSTIKKLKQMTRLHYNTVSGYNKCDLYLISRIALTFQFIKFKVL